MFISVILFLSRIISIFEPQKSKTLSVQAQAPLSTGIGFYFNGKALTLRVLSDACLLIFYA